MFSLTEEEQRDGWYMDDGYPQWYGGYGVDVLVKEYGQIGVCVNGDSYIVETNYLSEDDTYDLITALNQAIEIRNRITRR